MGKGRKPLSFNCIRFEFGIKYGMKNEKLNNCYEAAHREWMKNGGVLVHGCLNWIYSDLYVG